MHILEKFIPRSQNQKELQEAEQKEQILASIEQDYRQHIILFNRLNVYEYSPELNTLGIRSEEGTFYPIPSFENVSELIIKNWPAVQKKWSQGFTRLQLTPFALTLPRFVKSLIHETSLRFQQQRLFYTPPDSSPGQQYAAQFNVARPFYPESLKTTNSFAKILYFPKKYDRNTTGFSKDEVIQQTYHTSAPGWKVNLIEADQFVDQPPAYKNGRLSLPIGQSPEYYPPKLKRRMYAHETGFTIEDALTFFLMNVGLTGEVGFSIDGRYSTMFCLSNYFPQINIVYSFGLHRSWSCFLLGAMPPDGKHSYASARTAVWLK